MSSWIYALVWFALSLLVGSSLGMILLTEDHSWKTVYLPGKTTHGHYQIEMKCSECHDPELGVTSKSCLKCHEEELKEANDTHPAKKFNDPVNAARLSVLDAQNCITCHKEHAPAETHAMGVSMPEDFCFQCHQEIADERPSHKGMQFNSCQTSGCHNYHDNRALNENFLRKHLDEIANLPQQVVPERNALTRYLAEQSDPIKPLTAADARYHSSVPHDPQLIDDWAKSVHAQVGINCNDCHTQSNDNGKWQNEVPLATCQKCHADESDGFLQGMHGMRLAAGLSAMTPGMARLPMKHDMLHAELSCSSCHSPHDTDVRVAAMQACVKCHNDSHTKAYEDSPHARLWQQELHGELPPGSGVSCATCHMPREVSGSSKSPKVTVQHNQNANLQPNETMVRNVCSNCHGLQFSLDAMHDPKQIEQNFVETPAHSVESLEMVRKWFDRKKPSTP
ncbi:cytochrome c3 family protein [Bremerella sp. JC817]|uniref:cytochrome c3 family protein n=1 Tax=Bremerella sp. JC817 TaxID=3231756 RepID=UPI00345837C5